MTASCRLIALTVGRVYDVSLQDLMSDRRDVRIIIPRHMSWTLARRLTSRSLAEIGRMMGGRDHTTVRHGILKIEALSRTDAHVSSVYQTLLQTIGELAAAPADLTGTVSFHDVDPVDAARRIVATPLGQMAPTLDEIRSLAMGILHFEQELARRLAEPLPSMAETRYLLARRPADCELKDAGRSVLSTWSRLQEASLSGFGTINARRAFNHALRTLQTTIERT